MTLGDIVVASAAATAGLEVPFVSFALNMVLQIKKHVMLVESADAHVVEAGRRATCVQHTLGTLERAQFSANDPCFQNIVETLSRLNDLVTNWNDHSWWKKRVGFSVSNRSSLAQKYSEAFESTFESLEMDLHLLTNAIVSQGYAETKAQLQEDAEERQRTWKQIEANFVAIEERFRASEEQVPYCVLVLLTTTLVF